MSDLTTTRARAWRLEGAGGRVLGFTDHDRDLAFDGLLYRAGSGMTAKALVQGTGLAVDNTEAAGALSAAGLSEADILAGRWDGAKLEIWELDWQAVSDRKLLFRGSLGEITREGGAFRAELRGLSEALQVGGGRVFGCACPAVLGDARCGFQTSAEGFSFAAEILELGPAGGEAGGEIVIAALGAEPGWFAEGRIRFLGGAAEGLDAMIREDCSEGLRRRLRLWAAPGALPAPGDPIRIEAGCDKRFTSCAGKFKNALNFQGFPHVPTEDWLFAAPRPAGTT